MAAVDGRNCFELENHEYSAGLAFAQIRATEVLIEDATQTRHEVFHIEFDFHDFRELRGNDDVLAAFDPAMHLLHELGHGALGLRDTIGRTDLLRDRERHINQVRRELGLPERQRYESQTTMAVIPGDTFTSRKAQLTFIRSDDDGRKAKEFPLYFKADNVYLAKTLKGGSQAGRCSRRGDEPRRSRI